MVSVELSEIEWNHILGLVENDARCSGDIGIIRFNLGIYDAIKEQIEKNMEEKIEKLRKKQLKKTP